MKLLNKQEFKSLPANLKRKAICKDVLARMKLQLIKPETGSFFYNRGSVLAGGSSAQEKLNTRSCEVCAKGAIMCSWIGNFNGTNELDLWGYGEDYRREGSYPKALLQLFGREMLDNIEAAFERHVYTWHYNRQVGEKYATMNSKSGNLAKIMRYIIKNDGNFPVPQPKKKKQ